MNAKHVTAAPIGVLVALLLLAGIHQPAWGQSDTPPPSDPHSEALREHILERSRPGVRLPSSASAMPAFRVKNTDDETLLLVQENGQTAIGGEASIPYIDFATLSALTDEPERWGGYFGITNTESTLPGLTGFTHGTGSGGYFVSDGGYGVAGYSNGVEAFGGHFQTWNPENPWPALQAETFGTGPAGVFRTSNVENSGPVLSVVNEGLGGGLAVHNNNSNSNAGNAITGITAGDSPSHAGYFRSENPGNVHPALLGYTFGQGPGVRGISEGTGIAGEFYIDNADNEAYALHSFTNGLGEAAKFTINNPSSNAVTLSAYTDGNGTTGQFVNDGSGMALHADQNGNGDHIAAFSTGWAWMASIDRVGRLESKGITVTGGDFDGHTAFFSFPHSNSSHSAIQVSNEGLGAGIQVFNNNTSSSAPALIGHTEGTGEGGAFISDGSGMALQAHQNGTGDQIAVFSSNGAWKARIDRNGNVYASSFNPGGADLAEAFAVEGLTASYAPGDVLVISTDTDRTVAKSTTAYSTRVAGIYATKPGVLLSERGAADPLHDAVPMGVVGVLPTKVTAEGGPIRRGDLLVTASTPGHAMKADPSKLGIGMVLGKALANFDGPGTGVINVLVNVK